MYILCKYKNVVILPNKAILLVAIVLMYLAFGKISKV